ncbi:phospholipase D-like domain-containing protein [Kitasatospora kifunensis]|uniref:phospholipase D n=1 Tax=Kitasatospora kifunensis TaxID=58351 RepID=A0A7W7R8E4_KITKI|nr:phospholipase D-like domain-containing protein [Kitasatospora kifunensis]MBB4927337.1 phosphatidylserine/phosphatidylglycerophosphate/cardiolipin synthase-like enzyme [Kitasatospora kifunensis]
MFRRFTRRTAMAAAVCAASLATAVPAHAAGDYSAFAFSLSSSEPTIYNFINSATRTLDMTMYELSDTTAVNDLIQREQAGVTVRVILDRTRTTVNDSAYNTLKNAGVGVVWSSSQFVYTHQKTITVDGGESLVLSGNLTSKYYSTSRDYGVFDTDANDVQAIEQVFDADYAGTTITPSDGDNLLWSPTDSRDRLLSVINGATTTLDVEEEEFSDSAVVDAIAARAQAGVTVRLVLESPSSYSSEISEIENAGGTVVGYSSSTGFYVHAKAIVADYGLSTQNVEVGSMNDTTNSLDNNRELGIILTDSGVASVIENSFASDYANGTPA